MRKCGSAAGSTGAATSAASSSLISGIETGWAAGHGDVPLAAALNQQSPGDPGGWTSAAGFSFDKVLVAVGAPSGIPQAGGVHGQMPPGYP